ncbi:hypothetical protein ACFQL1_09560 [Halomicroarcula sp. GCM10025709]|uniref:hypothetical protein n=1 Tax=Haloarcula TaxID=2237 RepID=UPI0024C2DCBE|nr:hypothetical protein [Halomicroarcula sp. YJ-61-S]
MKRLPLVLALCWLTAGCLGVDFGGQPTPDPGQPISLSVDNRASEPYDVRVSVVPDDPVGVDVTYANGTVVRRPVSVLTDSPPSELGRVTDIRLVGGNVTSEQFRVPANSGIGMQLRDSERGSWVWLVVRRTTGDDRVRTWTRFRCQPDATAVEARLTIGTNESTALTTTCQG